MKTLALLRHGKSSWHDRDVADLDRQLTRRGRNASLSIGQEIRRRGLHFDRVIASPARRITETLDLVEEGSGSCFNARLDRRVYEARAQILLQIVQETEDVVGSLLLVGHNPGFQNLAMALAFRDDPHRDAVASHFPTAALAILRFPCESWRQVRAGTGEIISFTKPRDLGIAGPDQSETS